LQIDWFTFVAQIVNFLILVAVLHRLLYRPLISAMERREQEIARRLAEGEEMKRDAGERAEELERRMAELDERREAELDRIEREAGERRAELLAQVRAEVEEHQRRWAAALDREREGFLDELCARVGAQALTVARKALTDLADADLEHTVVNRFTRRLEELATEERASLRRAAERSLDEPLVESAFDLPDAVRGRIRDALAELIPEPRTVRFERSDSVGFGVELTVGGLELGWSLERYLGDLEQEIAVLLAAERQRARGHAEVT